MSEVIKKYSSESLIKPDTTFHIFFSEDTKENEVHTHDFIEIIYISDGSATETVNGQDLEVSRGDLLFMNYGCTHAFLPHGSVCFYNICFRPKPQASTDLAAGDAFSLLQIAAFEQLRNGQDTGLISLRGGERDEMENLLTLMHREYGENAAFKRAVLESYMSILLIKALRKSGNTAKEAPSNRELSDYIDANLGTDLTLAALSQRYFYNPSYFSRMFKKQFGVPLTEYIEKRRIALARRLLKETDMTVEQIAARVGYSSKTSFYRAFSKITGATPTSYRK